MGFILPVPSSDNPAEYAKALIARKGALETELDSQFSVLSANTSTMSSPLLDSEGFPRADIDVYAVRHARVRIIQLRNDLKEVMDQIAKALEGVYQRREGANDESGPSGEGGAAVNEDAETGLAEEEAMKPFARVDGVAPGSPAADAGLRREDLILQFGTLTVSSFSGISLQPLAELVAEFENRPLQVKLRRSGEITELTFTPRKNWGGRGLLGCHIVPYNA